MGNEVRTSSTSGWTLYFHVRRPSDLKRWNGSAWEAYNGSNWSTYCRAMTEEGTTAEFAASFPTGIAASGPYDVVIFRQLGGSPATTDTRLGAATLLWDGSAELTNLDLAATLAGSAMVITTVNPLDQQLNITVTQGDDYDADESRALVWTTSSADTWADLTGATIAFYATKASNNDNQGDATLTATGSVTVATGANKAVRVELTSANTDSLAKGSHGYNYQLVATLAGTSHKITLASGTMTVKARLWSA